MESDDEKLRKSEKHDRQATNRNPRERWWRNNAMKKQIESNVEEMVKMKQPVTHTRHNI